MRLRFKLNRAPGIAFCLLTTNALPTAQAEPPPSLAEQARIIALVRHFAGQYEEPDIA